MAFTAGVMRDPPLPLPGWPCWPRGPCSRPRSRHPRPRPSSSSQPPQTGLAFTHVSGATGQYYMAEQMGAGVALFDYDSDGDLDVFLVQGGPFEPGGKIGPTHPTSRLFRNDLKVAADGRRTLHFTDVTQAAGVGLRGHGMGAVVGDYDNDGDLDLFVTSFGPETLYRNNGDGTFTDVTKQAGRERPALERERRLRRLRPRRRSRSLRRQLPGLHARRQQALQRCAWARGTTAARAPIGRCRTGSTATRAAAGSPTSPRPPASPRPTARASASSTGDYNADGWLDLYVANDATPNQLWINQRNGTFVDEGLLSGSALNAAGNPEGSMGIASGDFDLDGDEDLFVTNIVGETFALYVNDGRGSFDDVRAQRGARRRRPRRSPASAPTGSTTTTTAGSISSSPTARSTSSKRSAGRSFRSGCGTSCSATPAPGDSRTRARRRDRPSNARRSVAERRLATSTTTATSTSS